MSEIPKTCGECPHYNNASFCWRFPDGSWFKPYGYYEAPPADCPLRQADTVNVPPKAVRDGVWVSRERYDRMRALCDAAVASWTNDALIGITSLLREVEAQRDKATARAERAEDERDERITLEQAAELLHDADNSFRVCLQVIRLAQKGDERQFCRVYQCARDIASIGIFNLKKLGRWYETEAGDV